MKTLLLSLLLALPAHAESLRWYDLSEGDSISLTEELALGEGGPLFAKDTRLGVQSREGLEISGHPVVLYRLVQESCPHPEWVSEMEIITPTGNDESTAVGVLLGSYCQWEIFVEQKDLLTNSFFQH